MAATRSRDQRGSAKFAATSINLTIHIEPPPVFTHETADFMQPMRTTFYFVARDEFDDGVFGVL